jgi:hypothetical protein
MTMQSNSYTRPSRTPRASRWRRLLNAIVIAAFGALFMFAASRATQATSSPHQSGLTHAAPVSAAVTAVAHRLDAGGTHCRADARRSRPALRAQSGDPSPLPDPWLDEEDDDDDDADPHRVFASARSHLTLERPLGVRPSRAYEGSPVPDGKTPIVYLTESVRRM